MKLKVAIAGTSLALLSAGVVIAASEDNSRPPVSMSDDVPRVTGVPTDLADRFALFREPASGVPKDVAARLSGGGQTGRNPELARKIETVTGAGYVMPGANGLVCIMAPAWNLSGDAQGDWGLACSPIGKASARGLRLGFESGSGESVETVLLPDGANAKVTTRTGAKRSIEAKDAVVSLRLDRGESILVDNG